MAETVLVLGYTMDFLKSLSQSVLPQSSTDKILSKERCTAEIIFPEIMTVSYDDPQSLLGVVSRTTVLSYLHETCLK